MAGGGIMFLAGVHWAYFAAVIASGVGLIVAVFQSRETSWQLLNNYQYHRIDTFIDQAPIHWEQVITSPNPRSHLGQAGGQGAGLCKGPKAV